MALSEKAQASLNRVVDKFKAGDLSAVTAIARIKLPDDAPASKWTFSNRVLAFGQTECLDCRGYQQWLAVGRQVTKGTHGAFILAPHMVKDKKDPDKQVLIGFLGICVHPYTNTEGEEGTELQYEPKELPPLVDVAKRLGVTMTWEPTVDNELGHCRSGGDRIVLGSQDPSVFFHELAHAVDAKLNGKLKGGQHTDQETIAEFTAAVLMELYGLGDHSGRAWSYIKMYDKDPITAVSKALDKVGKILEVLTGEEMEVKG